MDYGRVAEDRRHRYSLPSKLWANKTHHWNSPIPDSFNFRTFSLISSRNFWATTEALTLMPLVGSLTMQAFCSELMVQSVVVVVFCFCSNFQKVFSFTREGMFDFRFAILMEVGAAARNGFNSAPHHLTRLL